MARLHIVLASVIALAIAPALAQQQPDSRPKPTPLETTRAAFHDLIGVCIEARARGVRVQELPAELKDSVQLSPRPVVRPVGQDSSFVTDWQTRRSWGVSLRNIAPGCEVAMTPSPGYLEAFDASVEAKSAADILISKLPGLTERASFPARTPRGPQKSRPAAAALSRPALKVSFTLTSPPIQMAQSLSCSASLRARILISTAAIARSRTVPAR
jgi:hypothetical protein